MSMQHCQSCEKSIQNSADLIALLKRYTRWFDHHPAFFDAVTGQMREDAHALIARVEVSPPRTLESDIAEDRH